MQEHYIHIGVTSSILCAREKAFSQHSMQKTWSSTCVTRRVGMPCRLKHHREVLSAVCKRMCGRLVGPDGLWGELGFSCLYHEIPVHNAELARKHPCGGTCTYGMDLAQWLGACVSS